MGLHIRSCLSETQPASGNKAEASLSTEAHIGALTMCLPWGPEECHCLLSSLP
jgi:hypothetical protein